jgi:hypothetical protein
LILSLLFLSSFYCSFLGCKNVFTARSLDWMASLRSKSVGDDFLGFHATIIRGSDEAWQRDRNARAQGGHQGVMSGLAIMRPFRANFARENHEKTYLAVAAFDNSRGDACDRDEELGADPRSHN